MPFGKGWQSEAVYQDIRRKCRKEVLVMNAKFHMEEPITRNKWQTLALSECFLFRKMLVLSLTTVVCDYKTQIRVSGI